MFGNRLKMAEFEEDRDFFAELHDVEDFLTADAQLERIPSHLIPVVESTPHYSPEVARPRRQGVPSSVDPAVVNAYWARHDALLGRAADRPLRVGLHGRAGYQAPGVEILIGRQTCSVCRRLVELEGQAVLPRWMSFVEGMALVANGDPSVTYYCWPCFIQTRPRIPTKEDAK